MKICPECETIFGEHHKNTITGKYKCPSCKSENINNYAPLPRSENDYSEEVKEIITPFVEFTPLDDFQG